MTFRAFERDIPAVGPPDTVAERDREWARRIHAGDASAFDALCRAYATPLYEYAFRYVQCEDLSRDLVQDVFFRLWRRREHWETHTTVACYLFACIRNAALSHLRHEVVARRWTQRASAELRLASASPKTSDDVHDRLEREEMATRISGALAVLTPKQRLAIVLRWQRQLTNTEIAHAMGVSVTAVELLFGRAMKALRSQLAGILR